MRQESSRPETRHGRNRASVINGYETRLVKLEESIKQILELLSHRGQYQEALLNASEAIRNAAKEEFNKIEINHNNETEVVNVHIKARLSPYPGSTAPRYKLTDKQIPWNIPLPDYDPPSFTSAHVLSGPYWADQDLMTISFRPELPFNSYDPINKVDRTSHTGTYQVHNGLPLNPRGRTGMIGRGSLGRFGPNHAADPIATRWQRKNSEIVTDKEGLLPYTLIISSKCQVFKFSRCNNPSNCRKLSTR